eukprot:4308990-Pleurochrysis_carterae.AAC.4
MQRGVDYMTWTGRSRISRVMQNPSTPKRVKQPEKQTIGKRETRAGQRLVERRRLVGLKENGTRELYY